MNNPATKKTVEPIKVSQAKSLMPSADNPYPEGEFYKIKHY
ncbi:MAG: hypothetical protein ACI8ZB_004374 [Desulforhopalus sp.]|jgi:hypothetical protein